MKRQKTLLERVVGRLVWQRRLTVVSALLFWSLGTAGLAAVFAAVLLLHRAVTAIVVPVIVWLAWRWFADCRVRAVAAGLEACRPQLRGRVMPALELARLNLTGREGYSAELVAAALDDADTSIAGIRLWPLVSRRRLFSGLGFVLAVVLAGAALWLIAPTRMQVGVANLLGRPESVVVVKALASDTAVTRGEPVRLVCRVEPRRIFRRVRLKMVAGRRWHGAGERSAARNQPREVTRVYGLTGDSCVITLPVQEGFRYRFEVLGVKSEERYVGIIEPLALRGIEFEYLFPSYSKLAGYSASSPEIRALKGTTIKFRGLANRKITGARLVLGAETTAIALDSDSVSLQGSFRVMADGVGAILLAERSVEVMATELRVRAIPDEAPLVRVLVPGRDIEMPASMKIGLVINVLDDFGVRDIRLRWGIDSLDQVVRIGRSRTGQEDTLAYFWDLSGVGLVPGSVVRYRAEASDNDEVSGPKTGMSNVYSVRFPTMAEIYSASVRQAERTGEILAPLQQEQEQVGAEFQRAAEALARNRELSWDERQALSGALAQQEGLMQQVAELQQEVANLAEELSGSLVFDSQTMERLGQLQQLLSQVLPRELQRTLEQLRERLEANAPELRLALEKFQFEQERLRANIERAIELLQRIVEEQRLDELARRADELARAQEDVARQAEKQTSPALAERQNDIATGLDSLQSRLGELASALSDSVIADSLDKLLDELTATELAEAVRELARQMQTGQSGNAADKGKSLAADMRSAADRLKSLAEQFKRRRSADVAERLAVQTREALMLSQEQEQLETSGESAERLARLQAGLRDGGRVLAESLAALATRSLTVTPGMAQELASAVNAMDAAGRSLNEGNTAAARTQMVRARMALNNVARALLDALGAAMRGGGASGEMQGLMEQLSQMAGEQLGINSETGGIPIPMPGGMSASQLEAIARALSRQSALRQRLEQMMQTLGASQPGLMASLEQVVEEMKAVERDLADLNVSRQLVERQQQILSHLLDAQRSLRQRGQKEQREAETARPYTPGARPKLPEDRGERNRLLREELLRSLRQGYPQDYEDLIRAYFERLLYQ